MRTAHPTLFRLTCAAMVFAVAMTPRAKAGTLALPATQVCEAGDERWANVSIDKSKRPAPLLRVADQTSAQSPLVVSGGGWFRALPLSHVDHGAFHGTFAQFYPTLRPRLPHDVLDQAVQGRDIR